MFGAERHEGDLVAHDPSCRARTVTSMDDWDGLRFEPSSSELAP